MFFFSLVCFYITEHLLSNGWFCLLGDAIEHLKSARIF